MKSKIVKGFSIMCASLMVMSALVGCGSEKKGEEVIKIGGNLPMTGGVASVGQSANSAIKMAIDQANANGGLLGKKIEFVLADNKSEPSEAMNAMQKLIGQDKVVGVIGPIISSSAIASGELSNKSKIVTISPMATNPSVTVDKNGQTKPYMFRACFIDPFQGTVMAKFVRNNLKAKNVAIMIDNSSDYSKGLAKYFKQGFELTGGKVIAEESFFQKDTDFKATLTKIKAQNPDMIYIPAYYQEVGLIIKQARELGLTVPIAGGDGWDSNKLPEIAGKDALNHTYFSSLYSADDVSADSKANKVFVDEYKKLYGQKPDVFAALGYDSVNLLIKAIENAKSTDGEKIKASLEATSDFNGVSGSVKFDEYHNPVKDAVIIEFKDGKQEFNTKVSA